MENCVKKRIMGMGVILLALAMQAGTAAAVQAAPSAAAGSSSATTAQDAGKKAAHWRVTKKQRWYYIQDSGKRATGLVRIGKRKYYFDAKGIQNNGWQKIGKNYYYFRLKNGAKGYMESGKTINGIRLKKSGKAELTSYAKYKLRALTQAQQLVRRAAAPGAKRMDKLKASFQYLIKNYRYRGALKFYHTKNWDVDYALQIFEQGHGNCYAFGAAMAYIGNACGYPCAAVSSGGHGWAEINGYVSDPTWHITDTSHSYFLVKYSQSGVDGRPNYRKGRLYVHKI